MNRHQDPNPFDEKEDEIVNPFSKGAGGAGRVPVASRPVGFGNNNLDATVDIPLDTVNDSSKKQRELSDWGAELRKREMIFYFVGFGLFCLESLPSLWVLQKIYLYFRGNK